MGIVEILILFVESVFLFIQGLLVYGYVGDTAQHLMISSLDSNIVCWMIGMRISSWGIILGILGTVIILASLIENKVSKKTDEDVSKKYYILVCVGYFVLCLCSLL